jgi:hypothetical protein
MLFKSLESQQRLEVILILLRWLDLSIKLLSQVRKLNSNRNLQDLKNQISTLRKTLGFCDLTYKQQAEKIAGLQAKRIALEENNNRNAYS